MAPPPPMRNTARPPASLFMPKKGRQARPAAAAAAAAAAASSSNAPPPASAPAPTTLKPLGKQRLPDPSPSPAPAPEDDLSNRPYEEYDIVSMGTPAALDDGNPSGADFNIMRLYQLNPSFPLPDLSNPAPGTRVYMNRQNATDKPFMGGPVVDDEKEAKRVLRDSLRKPVQNGPNGEWRVPVIDRELTHQVDQRTGEKMWRVVQDPSLVAPEARKVDKKDPSGGRFEKKRRGGGGGGGRRQDDRGKVFARSGNHKDGAETARVHQLLNREKLPIVIEGTFPNPQFQPSHPERTDSRGVPIPRTVDQKWVGRVQSTENEAWAALMFESSGGEQRIRLKVVDREYKFEPHRHINVPSTSWEVGKLLTDNMEGKNTIPRFAYRDPADLSNPDDAGPSTMADTDVKPSIRNTGTGGNPDAFPRMMAPRGRTMDRAASGGSLKGKLERGAFSDDVKPRGREPGGWFFGDADDDAPRRGRGIERADDEELDYNEDVADDEEVVALGVDDEELERETKARLQEEFLRANATAGNLQRDQSPESDDDAEPPHVRERKLAEARRERKMKRRLRRERKARGEAGSEDDDDDDDDDDSLFGSDDDSSTEGEEDVKPVVEDVKPIIPTTPITPSLGSPPRSRAASPSTTSRLGSARSVSPMTSAGAGHHLVASRALSPQGKRSSQSSRKRKNDESQTAPPEAGRASSAAGGSGPGAALQSFKKSRPNTDAGERRVTASDVSHVPVASSAMDVDQDIKPGTPVAGHPTGLPKHKARGKKKRVEESADGQATTGRVGSPAVGASAAQQTTPSSNARSASPAVKTSKGPRDASPAGSPAPAVGHHPMHGPLTPQEYQEAIVDDYDGKITETEFRTLLRGHDRMTVKEIREHFGKRMKKNHRGILTAKFLSWKYCNSVEGGFELKNEFR